MTNREYRNAVYSIMGLPPIEKEEPKKDPVDIKKELRKQKQLKDHYLAKYRKEVLDRSNKESQH